MRILNYKFIHYNLKNTFLKLRFHNNFMKNKTVNQVCTVVLIQQKNPKTVLILQKYFPDLVSSDYVINKLKKKKTFNV